MDNQLIVALGAIQAVCNTYSKDTTCSEDCPFNKGMSENGHPTCALRGNPLDWQLRRLEK